MSEEKKIVQLENGLIIEIEEGSILDGRFTGKGRISHKYNMKAKKILEGQFIEGKLQGKGKATFIDEHGAERLYEGLFKDGRLVVEKKAKLSKRELLENELILNEPKEEITGNVFSGEGLLKNLYTGDAFVQYEGEFKDKKLNGQGKIIVKNRKGLLKERTGNFTENKLDGQGKLVIEKNNGKKFGFEGSFKNNIPSGKGKLFAEKTSGEYLEQEGSFEGKNFTVNN